MVCIVGEDALVAFARQTNSLGVFAYLLRTIPDDAWNDLFLPLQDALDDAPLAEAKLAIFYELDARRAGLEGP